MAYLTSFTFAPTGDPIMDAATQGSAWNLSQTNVMHWTLANGWLGEYWIDPDFTVGKIDQVLSVIEYYVNIDFVFGGYFTNPGEAGFAGSDLVFSLYSDDRYGANPTWAVGFFPNYNNIPVGPYPG